MDTVNMTNLNNIELHSNEDQQTTLGEMAAKIAFHNFQWRFITLVVFLSTQNSHTVDTFLSRYNNSVVVKLGKFRPLHKSHIPQYVVFAEEYSEITEYVNWLMEMKYVNTGKYLLICYSADNQKCNETKVFRTLEKNYILNAIFLRISVDDEPVLFTYRVILPGVCKNNNPERLNITNGCYKDYCFKHLYRENLRNLQRCPLIVSTFEQPPFMYLHNGTGEPTGGDADMLKIVTSALNATLIIKTPADGNDWGHYVGNNWTGSMGDVFNDRAHLSVCSLPLSSTKYANFQISFIYNTMDIVWVAQLPALKPSWEKLLRPFNINARLCMMLTFIFVMILTGLTRTDAWRNARKKFNVGIPKQSLFFYSWIIFLGIPIGRMPSKRAFIVVVYSWIWFCFIIRNCYQAALINALKKNAYERNFETFNDVFSQKYTFGGQESYREYYVHEKKIYDNWKLLHFKEAHDMLHRISNGTSSFVLAYNKEMVIEHLLRHNGTRRLQMIPQKIVNSPTVMYLRRYSPLVNPLNIALSRAVEAGYAQAWHMRFAPKKHIIFAHADSKGYNALNLGHFGGCIMLTAVGWMLSLVFFILEVCCGRLDDNTYG